MNQESLIKHYRICKHLINFSILMHNNPNNSNIASRMQWNVLDTDTDSYNLFFNRYNNTFEFIRTQKLTNIGYKIAVSSIGKNGSYNHSNNYIFGGLSNRSYGIRVNGEIKVIKYVPPDNSPAIELDPLPIESMRGLLIDNSYEELEFQYGTLHNFENDSFPMYCIYSLLFHVDDIAESIAPDFLKNIDLLKPVYDEDVNELELNLDSILHKAIKDIEYVGKAF